MPVVPPNISTLTTPAIQVTSIGDVSYKTIQQSIGTYFYKVNNIILLIKP